MSLTIQSMDQYWGRALEGYPRWPEQLPKNPPKH